MPTDFASLQRAYYQLVAITPDWRVPARADGSDIVLHLPVLEWFASQCRHCTEFGVRDGHSTVALLSGCRGHLVSYDIQHSRIVDRLRAMPLPCSWEFHQANTADPSLVIAETELLFIDTLHTFEHVSRELALHGRRATRFLAFHDTATCGQFDVSGSNPSAPGILPAIENFLSQHPGEYRTAYRTESNNGLWVLEKSDFGLLTKL